MKWSEAVVSCNGKVSQYILCISPTAPGSEPFCTNVDLTQTNLTLKANLNYTLAISAIACNGDEINSNDTRSILLTGNSIQECLYWSLHATCLLQIL